MKLYIFSQLINNKKNKSTAPPPLAKPGSFHFGGDNNTYGAPQISTPMAIAAAQQSRMNTNALYSMNAPPLPNITAGSGSMSALQAPQLQLNNLPLVCITCIHPTSRIYLITYCNLT